MTCRKQPSEVMRDWYPCYLRSKHGTTVMGLSARPRIPIGYLDRWGLNFRRSTRPSPHRQCTRPGTGYDQYTAQMPSNQNVCGQRIDYEPPAQERFSESTAVHYENAYFEVENTLAITAGIQNERTNEDGEITEPLSLLQVKTILEVGTLLQRSLAVLNDLEGSPEGIL